MLMVTLTRQKQNRNDQQHRDCYILKQIWKFTINAVTRWLHRIVCPAATATLYFRRIGWRMRTHATQISTALWISTSSEAVSSTTDHISSLSWPLSLLKRLRTISRDIDFFFFFKKKSRYIDMQSFLICWGHTETFLKNILLGFLLDIGFFKWWSWRHSNCLGCNKILKGWERRDGSSWEWERLLREKKLKEKYLGRYIYIYHVL